MANPLEPLPNPDSLRPGEPSLQTILTRDIEDWELVLAIVAVNDCLLRQPGRQREWDDYVATLENEYGPERVERLLSRAERLLEPPPTEPDKENP